MAEKFANVLSPSDGTITTLSGAINSSVTTFATATAFPTALRSGLARVRIDGELMLLTVDSSGAVTNAVRGVESTVAASHAPGAKVRHTFTAGSLAAALDQLLPGTTADTFEAVRYITVANVVKAIPASTLVPTMPTGVVVNAKLSSVRVSWTAATVGGSSYAVYRDGVRVATVSALAYHDIDITSGSTYSYRVQTIDSYGQRSGLTDAVTGFVDPSTNSAPVVVVTSWPIELVTTGRSLLRTNSSDIDAQELEVLLEVDEGTITATDDPTAWWWTP